MATVHKVSLKTELDAREAQAKAEKLHDTIKKTKEVASGINVSGGTTAPKSALSPSASKFKEQSDYNAGRGIGGATGAASRDFAKEAKGLGGLVRLYATYAANVFAVSAAFNALSAAQDTANMVQGLNQLGAASGVALGNLSKNLVKVTDGAVSLREAMEATVKASSSGMVSKDILRMGEVAKKASQALGINMPDALSRISRGITKLEPELLDELGIFARIDPALQAYAKQVGKSVSSLSQFERQMAFSNAVLEEGERKFGAINIETNTYTKLLAQLKDTATAVGTAINSVLVPIIGVLQSNPTALYTILAGLTAMLLKQAIPAFGQLNASIKEQQRVAASASKARMDILTAEMDIIKKRAGDTAKAVYAAQIAASDAAATAAVDRFDEEDAKLKIARAGKDAKSSASIVTEIRNMENLTELTKAQVQALEKYSSTLKDTGKNTAGIKEFAKITREVYDSHELYTQKVKEAAAAEEHASKIAEENAKKSIHYRITEAQHTKELATLTRNNISAQAGQDVMLKGWQATWREMSKSIDEAVGEKKLTSMQAGFTKASAGLQMLTGMVSGLVQAYGVWAEFAAVVLVGLGILDGWLDKTSRQAQAFKDSLNSVKDSSNTLSDNLDRLSTISLNEFFNAETIKGTSTAIIGVSDSVSTLGAKFEKLKEAQAGNWWGRMKDGFASMWGGDAQTKFTEGVAESVSSLLKSLERAPAKFKATSEAIKQLTGVSDPTNLSAMEKALKGMDPKSDKFKELTKILQQLKVDAGNLSTEVTAFKTSLTEFGDAAKALSDQFIDKDPLTVFALKGLSSTDKLQKALKGDMVGALTAIKDALDDLNKKPLFGSDVDIASIGKYKTELESIQKTLFDTQKEIDELIAKRGEAERDLRTDSFGNVSNDEALIKSLNAQIKQKEAQIASARGSAPQLVAEIEGLSKKGADGFLNILDAKIAATMAKGGTAFMGAVLSNLGNLPGVAKMEASLQMGEIGYQQTLIKLQMQMLEQQTLSRVNSDLLVKYAELGKLDSSDNIDRNRIQKISAEIRTLQSDKEKISTTKDPRALLSMSKDKNGEAGDSLRNYALAITGMQQQLRALGDQAAAVQFNANIKELNAKADAFKRTVDLLKEQNSLEISNIDLQEKLNGTISTEEILKRSTLAQENLRADAAKEITDILYKQATIDASIVALASSKNSEEAKNSALKEKSELQSKLANITSKLSLNIVQSEYETRVKLNAEAKKAFEYSKTMADLAEQTRVSKQNSKLNGIDSSIGIQKDLGINTGAQDLMLQGLREEEQTRQAIYAARSSAEAELFAKAQEYSLTSSAVEQERIQAQMMAISEKYTAIISGEASAAEAGKQRLAVQEQILETTRQQELATMRVQSATESLTAVFGSVGEAAGSLLTTFDEIGKRRANQAKQEAKLDEIMWSSTASVEERNKAEKDLNHLKETGAEQAKKDDISLISGTKKLFKEKTFAYKALSAIEKVMHIQKMFAMAIELKTMLVNLATSVSAAITAATATATANVPGVFASFMAWLGPWGIAAAAAALAAIGLSGGGGPTMPGAAELQETQGTGSVLGDEKAKNRDVEVGIENLNKLTLFGLNTSQNMLSELEQISYNTSNLGNTLLRIPGLFGGKSTFGTKEKSNPGFLGLFSSSTAIIDSGIKFAQGMFQQYETVQKTSSGFLGIGGGTKTYQNMKPLEQEAQDQLNKLYKDYLGVAGQAMEDLGFGAKDLNMQLIDSAIDMEKFNVSLKGLSAEDAQAAIQGVFGNVISDALKSTYPFLSKFQKAGEGLLATAIRVSQEMNYVGKAMTLTGMKFKYAAISASTLSEADVAKAKAARASLTAAKAEEAAALANLNERRAYTGNSEWGNGPDTEGVAAAEERYAAAKTASQAAQDALTATLGQNQQASIEANIALSQALIDGAGGMEAFAEQIDFYTENFMTQSQRAVGMYSIYNDQLNQTNTKFKDLGLSATMTRQEFSSLVQAQDLNTEAGRKQWQALMDLAPALDAAKDAMAEFLDSVGMGASVWDDMLTSIMDGDMEDIGSSVAETVKDGFYAAMGENFKSQIIAIVMEQLITPVITSVITGSVTGALLTQATMDAIVAKIVATARAYAAVLNDPAFQQAVASISSTVATAFQGIDRILGGINKKTFAFQDLGLGDLNKELIKAYKDQRTEVKKTRDELARTIDKFKNFANSLKEFKASLLLGAESPLTPAERYAEAKRQFEDISARAAAGDETAMGQVQSAAKALLDASRGMFASGGQYTDDFNMVQQILDSLINGANGQISIDEQQLAALDDQIAQLDAQIALLEEANGTNKSIEQILIEIRDKESKANQLGIDQTVKGFHVLDKNLDGLLTLDELKASGMASDKDIARLHAMMDTNGDGQISRLEAIAQASEGTTFSLEGIASLMDAGLDGTISMVSALTQIVQLLELNGGPGGGGVIGGGKGYISKLGGGVYGETIYGKTGQIASKTAGIQAILDYVTNIGNHVEGYSAAGLYGILKDVWGMDSGMVAYLMGGDWDSKKINAWFQLQDPTLPTFAVGTNYVPEDMTARIHKGERIVPAADNTRLMDAIQNKELLKEVQKLNAKIESLEETVAQGAVLNANATDRNTDEISRTVKDAGSTASHTEAIRRRAAIK